MHTKDGQHAEKPLTSSLPLIFYRWNASQMWNVPIRDASSVWLQPSREVVWANKSIGLAVMALDWQLQEVPEWLLSQAAVKVRVCT